MQADEIRTIQIAFDGELTNRSSSGHFAFFYHRDGPFGTNCVSKEEWRNREMLDHLNHMSVYASRLFGAGKGFKVNYMSERFEETGI